MQRHPLEATMTIATAADTSDRPTTDEKISATGWSAVVRMKDGTQAMLRKDGVGRHESAAFYWFDAYRCTLSVPDGQGKLRQVWAGTVPADHQVQVVPSLRCVLVAGGWRMVDADVARLNGMGSARGNGRKFTIPADLTGGLPVRGAYLRDWQRHACEHCGCQVWLDAADTDDDLRDAGCAYCGAA
jgi:hypothetical protein